MQSVRKVFKLQQREGWRHNFGPVDKYLSYTVSVGVNLTQKR